MNLSYSLLLDKISREQGLGLKSDEIPLIISTDLVTYYMAFITYEDEKYLVIVVPDETGAEFAKILNKKTVLSLEIIYEQTLEIPNDIKRDMEVI